LSKIKILVYNLNLGQKSKFWSNIEIMIKIEIFFKNGFAGNRHSIQKSLCKVTILGRNWNLVKNQENVWTLIKDAAENC